jgi:hypothetical protein
MKMVRKNQMFIKMQSSKVGRVIDDVDGLIHAQFHANMVFPKNKLSFAQYKAKMWENGPFWF